MSWATLNTAQIYTHLHNHQEIGVQLLFFTHMVTNSNLRISFVYCRSSVIKHPENENNESRAYSQVEVKFSFDKLQYIQL